MFDKEINTFMGWLVKGFIKATELSVKVGYGYYIKGKQERELAEIRLQEMYGDDITLEYVEKRANEGNEKAREILRSLQ